MADERRPIGDYLLGRRVSRAQADDNGENDAEASADDIHGPHAALFVAASLAQSHYRSSTCVDVPADCPLYFQGAKRRSDVVADYPLKTLADWEVLARRELGERPLDSPNVHEIRVEACAFLGSTLQYRCLGGRQRYEVSRPNQPQEGRFGAGERAFISWRPEDCLVLPDRGEA